LANAPAKTRQSPQSDPSIAECKFWDGESSGCAREWVAPLVALETANRLVRNCGSDPKTTSFVDNLDIFIDPSINTDGGNYSELLTFNVDAVKPTVNIATPRDGASIKQGMPIPAVFNCEDTDSGLATCVGTARDGTSVQRLDTSTVGPHTFPVTATDVAGNTRTMTVGYTVTPRA
jgi:hypothetical protein